MNLNHIAKKPFFDLFYSTPCMPQLLRAALNDACTFDPATRTGGPNAALRLHSVLHRPENKGLEFAIHQIKDIKKNGNHITTLLSYSDLIQLGGIAAVEYCGGPSIMFQMGRKDLKKDADAHEEGRIRLLSDSSNTVLAKFVRLGLSKQEIVALMGWHTLGFGYAGLKGRWCQNPYVFDNTYYKELLLGDKSKFLKTKGDLLLTQDSEMREFVEKYAQDERAFFIDYANVHSKVSQLGQEEFLLDEFDVRNVKNGGYIEPPRTSLPSLKIEEEDEETESEEHGHGHGDDHDDHHDEHHLDDHHHDAHHHDKVHHGHNDHHQLDDHHHDSHHHDKEHHGHHDHGHVKPQH